MSYSFFIL